MTVEMITSKLAGLPLDTGNTGRGIDDHSFGGNEQGTSEGDEDIYSTRE
jgi:hypothetical protein